MHRMNSDAVRPFFASLHQTDFAGDIVVFASAASEETIRDLEGWGARVVPFTFRGNHVRNKLATPWWLWKRIFRSSISAATKERLAHQIFHLFYRRHLLYLDFLRAHGFQYRWAFFTDCRDVFFQANPFNWNLAPGLHVFLEEERNKLGKCPHHVRWITSQFGKEFLSEWTDATVSCAGTVLGDVPSIMRYLKLMISLSMQVRSLRAYDGDQGVHNYLVQTNQDTNVTVHENRQGPIMTLGPVRMDELRFSSDGLLLTEDGTVVPVLHQYDRDPELRIKISAQIASDPVPRASQLPLRAYSGQILSS